MNRASVTGIAIRAYKNADKNGVVKLFDDFQDYLMSIDNIGIVSKAADYGNKYLKLTLERISDGKGIMYVAVYKGRIIGLIVADVSFPSKDPGVKPGARGRVIDLYVEKGHRREGIGLALMKRAESYLKSRHCKHIFLEVFVPNTIAHKFYTKLGYKDCDMDMLKII